MAVMKKKVLFINMEYTQDEINEPINIDIILQYVPQELFNESDITLIYRDLSDIENVMMEDFDIVLISTKISSFPQMRSLLDLCKEKLVIVGGILAICAFDELARLYPNVIFNTGEGETNIKSLLQLAYTASTINGFKQEIIDNKISNICFYDETSERIYCSKRTVCDLKLQEYPKHYKLDEIIAKKGLVRMETSRGCPWNKCSFCIMPWKFCGETWRSFSSKKIENEISYLIKNGATQILFTDEDFVGNYEHISSLCSIIKKCTLSYKRAVLFGGSTSVLTLLKLGDKLDYCLREMQEAGITFIFIGIESGCDSQLKRYCKGVTVSMNEKLIKKLQQYNFEIDFGFILFDADTTMKELEENLNFINRTGLKSTLSRFIKRLRVTPHTVFYENYQSRNLIISDLNINELCYEYSFCNPEIDLIYSYVKKLDVHILKESYQLQALIRSTATQAEKSKAQIRLALLRECGYNFLYQCVGYYKKKQILLKEDIEIIYNKCLEQGGIFNEEY